MAQVNTLSSSATAGVVPGSVYYFNLGNGQQTIATPETVSFGMGLLPEQLNLTRIGNDLLVRYAQSNDALRLQDFFFPNDMGVRHGFLFDNAQGWDFFTIRNMLLTGGNDSDSLTGFDGSDNMQGNLGDDALDGAAGYDTLSGGYGNDTLSGGADRRQRQ